ncbi:MAG: LSU ribosomal protein L37AE [Candidatus Bathyarchaeota archaeon B24]|nr:MAG: LSU ribosomal protein L37AE [Candidatus Bathyarchaeota archaeon B24]MCD6444681.1 50S ribosomal protein L37ae [Candidatus Bathyarchaeota archaeon]RLI25937.1 MAG: 50S ribosomal protein L37ae [Candidatus Bathyarchaeota archaeon]
MPGPKNAGVGSLKAKYGAPLRKRYARVMRAAKSVYVCPKCGMRRVKRVSVGVWKCFKCGYKFAGGAYQPTTEMGRVAARIRG